MARLGYDITTFGGEEIAKITADLIKLKSDVVKTRAMMVAVVGTGSTADLEGSAEFNVEVGDGGLLYNALTAIKTALDTVPDSTLAELSMGEVD